MPNRSGVLTGARIALLFTRGPFVVPDKLFGACAPEVAGVLSRSREATYRDLRMLEEAGLLQSARFFGYRRGFLLAADPFRCLPPGWERMLRPEPDARHSRLPPLSQVLGSESGPTRLPRWSERPHSTAAFSSLAPDEVQARFTEE